MPSERPILRRILDLIAVPDPSYNEFWESIGLADERGSERIAEDLEWGRETVREDRIDHGLESHLLLPDSEVLEFRFRHGFRDSQPGIYPGERNDGLGEPK